MTFFRSLDAGRKQDSLVLFPICACIADAGKSRIIKTPGPSFLGGARGFGMGT